MYQMSASLFPNIVEYFSMGGKGGFAKKSKYPDINIYLYDIYV